MNDDPLIEYLTFILDNETYGIDVLYVQEVLRSPVFAPVPGSPSHVLGMINLRDVESARKMTNCISCYRSTNS